jgi:hypothetical protein
LPPSKDGFFIGCVILGALAGWAVIVRWRCTTDKRTSTRRTRTKKELTVSCGIPRASPAPAASPARKGCLLYILWAALLIGAAAVFASLAPCRRLERKPPWAMLAGASALPRTTAVGLLGGAMTEQEWLACTDPQNMLLFLGEKATARKLRLYLSAWGYLLWGRMTDEYSKEAVIAAERFADDLIGVPELIEAYNAAQEAWKSIRVAFRGKHSQPEKAARARAESKAAAEIARNAVCPDLGFSRLRINPWRDTDKTIFILSNIVRDLFVNPFRPVTADPAWLAWNDGSVRKLAQAIYEEGAFDRLPLLADALEDAGCHNADILTHCRQPGEHVRGCWAVDLVLGKN